MRTSKSFIPIVLILCAVAHTQVLTPIDIQFIGLERFRIAVQQEQRRSPALLSNHALRLQRQ